MIERDDVLTIAFVSGKGGSGKTLIATTFANIVASNTNMPVFLIDADVATGGMTFFLNFTIIPRAVTGFCDFILARRGDEDVEKPKIVFAESESAPFKFIPIGNNRRFLKASLQEEFVVRAIAELLDEFIDHAVLISEGKPIVIVDCRGGIDQE